MITETWDRYIGENISFIYTIWTEVDSEGYKEGEINFYSLAAEDVHTQGCPITEAIAFAGDDPDPNLIVQFMAEEWEEAGEVR